MKTRIKNLFLLLAMLGLMPSAEAQFTFTTNNGAITITGYNTAAGLNAVIPATTNGYSVTSIGNTAFKSSTVTNVIIPNSVTNIGISAFMYCTYLTSVTIGSNVTSIGQAAFYECVSLRGVIIPNNVTSIGDYGFYECNLTNVIIPDSVTNLGSVAFYNCTKLAGVTIGNGVTSIGDGAFERCFSLTNFAVAAGNPDFKSVNGVLFDKAQVTLLQFPEDLGGSYIIPNSVTSIGQMAFEDCDSLTNVIIPNSVTNIGQSAFEDCISLTNIIIPNSVPNIGEATFNECVKLANVTIGIGVTSIEDDTFSFCYSLTSVTIPNSVTNIGNSVFEQCYSLTNVTIGNSVISIGQLAFIICTNLTSVLIPASVTNIGQAAFASCTSLTNIAVATGNPDYSSLNGVLFDKDQATLVGFPGGKGGNYAITNSVTSIGAAAFEGCASLISVIIPGTVTNIGQAAFDYCTGLTSVSIGNGVTSIGSYAFANCTNIFSVTIPASVTKIDDLAFNTCSKLKEIYFQGKAPSIGANIFSGVNSAMTVYYLPNTTGWGTTFGGHLTAITPLSDGLTSFSNLPVVFYPQAGTNYTLQMSTNPASGNWVAVSNSVHLNCLQITNFSNTAFFRLQAASGSVPSPVIGSYGTLPVWIYPTNASYTLQMEGNLAPANWVAATSGIPFISVQITNAPANAVFRLH